MKTKYMFTVREQYCHCTPIEKKKKKPYQYFIYNQ